MVKHLLDNRIIATPDICGGHPRIIDSRIRVVDIVAWYNGADKSAEEIASEYDLELADVYAAMAFYFANIEEMKVLMKKDKAFVEQLRKKIPSKLPKL